MEHDPRPESTALFTTLEQIRSEHARLLDADCGDDAPGPEFWVAVQRFATCVAESGIYFDEPHEVKACQGYLSYWERELSRARAERRLTGNLRVPELKPYDEAALRDLQTRYTSPFEGLAKEAHALVKDVTRTRSKNELVKLVEGMAAAAGLRFELDLVKEISNQVAGDTFAPTLVEFCLHHLFEDPGTRVGNKLRRLSNERSFSCLAYLVDKTEQLYTQQGPTEKRAMLDALSLYATRYDPRLPWDTIPGPEIEAVDGAASPTFKDSGGRTMPLRSFLVSSRLLFEYGPGLSIVHPGLFRRWPELLAEIRVRKDREQRRRRVRLYGAIAAAVVFFAFGAWQYLARQGEEDQARANALAAEAYSNLWKYEACRVRQKKTDCDSKAPLENARAKAREAVNAAPTRRAMMALNDAIGAKLGADVNSPGAEKPLAWRPPGPKVGPCDGEQGQGGALCFVGSAGQLVNLAGLPESSGQGLPFGTDRNEEWVAVAWPKSGGTNEPPDGTLQVAVFHLVQGNKAVPVGAIRNTKCVGKVAGVRVSSNGSAVTIDCEPSSEDGPTWALITLSGEAEKELAMSPEEEDSIDAIYFASPDEKGVAKGFAKLKDGGVLEITNEPGKDPDILQTDILRVMGRPGHVAYRSERGFAATGKFGAPMVVVHEKTGRGPGASNEGRDTIFAVPFGLGTPTQVNFSPKATCVEVRTMKGENQAYRYHVVLDAEVLKEVAKGMAASPPRYDAHKLCGFNGPAN